MRTIHSIEGRRPIHLWTDDVEASAMVQLENLSKLPFLHPHGVAAMPDVHTGYGSTVGSVIATVGAIIPAAVGVDIGCGMMAVMTSLKATDLPDSLTNLRHDIERGIPLGAGGAHQKYEVIDSNAELVGGLPPSVYGILGGKDPLVRAIKQLGTLGSGNHFIEVCLDDADTVWVMLHSGSRGVGNMIGQAYISLAKKDMEQYFVHLPDEDLAYFPVGTPHFDDYVEAVGWSQNYAKLNRERMMASVLNSLAHNFKDFRVTLVSVNCHHNYVELENHYGKNTYVTRKGAIRAREGDLGIIPGSMGAKSYIVMGKGNPQSYSSCSHGAGRRMSRTEAKKRFTLDDLLAQTEGVECNKVASVIDEIPSAYKNIDKVMAEQTDLVEVLYTLKQVLCIKGQ